MLLGQLMSLAAGRLGPRAAQGGDVEMLPCSRVTITAHQPVPTQIDGDVFGTTPLEVDAGTARGAPDRAAAADWQRQLGPLTFH